MARTKKKKVILSKQAKRRMADRTSKCYIIYTHQSHSRALVPGSMLGMGVCLEEVGS